MKALSKALMVGLLAFTLLLGMGEAWAIDVPDSSDSDNTLSATVSSDSPEIFGFDITDATDASFMAAQLDVLNTFYFNVTISDGNGWGNLGWANIRVWFDGGDERTFALQTTGANYRIDLNYTNAGDLTIPDLAEWTVPEGNLVYNAADSQIFTNVVNQNYTFKLSFQLQGQVRYGIDPITSGTVDYDDAQSWNAEVRAQDLDNPAVFNRQNAAGVFHEFGVFMFTSVVIASDWNAGTIAPGGDAPTLVGPVTHQSNRGYNMKVWFETTLTTGGGDTIAVTNINITAAGDTTDDIIADTSFGGLGEPAAVNIHIGPGHEVDANSRTTGVQFGVFVPFGSAAGIYVATLVIKVTWV